MYKELNAINQESILEEVNFKMCFNQRDWLAKENKKQKTEISATAESRAKRKSRPVAKKN